MVSDRRYPQRLAAARAGYLGDSDTIRELLDHHDPATRVRALGAAARSWPNDEFAVVVGAAARDPSPVVRRRAAQLVGDPVLLVEMLDDPDAMVAVAACDAIGEADTGTGANAETVAKLSDIATGHDDPLCREAAVAALGSLGHPRGLEAVLAACGDVVAVRRRAVLMLAAWDDPRCEDMLERMLADRDRQVRQAAEDLRAIDAGDSERGLSDR